VLHEVVKPNITMTDATADIDQQMQAMRGSQFTRGKAKP
jgi:hypothetical protein